MVLDRQTNRLLTPVAMPSAADLGYAFALPSLADLPVMNVLFHFIFQIKRYPFKKDAGLHEKVQAILLTRRKKVLTTAHCPKTHGDTG
jgi:hypothetical protein